MEDKELIKRAEVVAKKKIIKTINEIDITGYIKYDKREGKFFIDIRFNFDICELEVKNS